MKFHLAEYLPRDQVQVDIEVSSKKRAFEQIGLLFEQSQSLNRGDVTDNLFARERLGSTGIGDGAAIPHGCIKGLEKPSAAVIRLKEPLAFDAIDDKPVQLLIILLVPENSAQRHLDTLSQIAEMLSQREMREKLMQASDAEALHALITGWQSMASAA